MKTLDLLIVDDHSIIRDGLRTMLESHKGDMEFRIYEAENEKQAMQIVATESIDCVIMDFQLPDKKGHEITESILEINSNLKVLGLSNYDEYAYALDMLKAGAKGYVLKNIGVKELVSAIQQIMDGNVFYSNEIANKLINYKLKELLIKEDSSAVRLLNEVDQDTPLSNREMQILRLIAGEYTNNEIADKLLLSKRTIDNHRQNMLNKLHFRNTAGLVRYAYQHGIV